MMQIKKFLLRAMLLFIGLLGRLLGFYIIFFFLMFGLSLLPRVSQIPAFQGILKIERTIKGPAVFLLQKYFPTRFGDTDYSSWIFIGTVTLAWFAIESRRARFEMKAGALQQGWRDEARLRAEEEAKRDAAAGPPPPEDPVQAAIEGEPGKVA